MCLCVCTFCMYVCVYVSVCMSIQNGVFNVIKKNVYNKSVLNFREILLTMSNKKHCNIPVVVCEFHQEVLAHIHRFVARKRLPFNGLKMIHFDSHPDLAFPNHLLAEDCFCKEKMYNDLEIADWILPLMYAGHLKSLIWVKPPWANQIPDVQTTFAVGKDKSSEKLRFVLVLMMCLLTVDFFISLFIQYGTRLFGFQIFLTI